MNTEATPKNIALIGMGQMGHYYAPILVRNLGIPAESIVMYDIRPQAMDFSEAELKKAPELEDIRRADSLEEALEGAHIAFNLTNSPSHLTVFRAIFSANVKYVFAEKPIVSPSQAHDFWGIYDAGVEIVAGYVINFSPAVQKLMAKMKEMSLVLLEMEVTWGKNRSADKRPTAGVVDDEMPHGIELFRLLSTHVGNAEWEACVTAMIERKPYANADVQREAMKVDPAFRLDPPSLVRLQAMLECDTEGREPKLNLEASYVRDDQKREVTCLLTSKQGWEATHKARFVFDTEVDGRKGDLFEFGPIDGEMTSELCEGNKLLEMMLAFFAFTNTGERDKRLTDVIDAMRNMGYATAAYQSASQSGVTIDVS